MRKTRKNAVKMCPVCGGEPTVLGTLGLLRWYRCRACGAEYHGKVRRRPSKVRRNSTATVVAMEPKGAIYTLQTFRGRGASFGAKMHVSQIRRRAAHGGDYFTGWKAGYAMLKNRRARKNWSKADFLRFLRDTLIPDLRESGRVYTAKDFVTAAKYIIKPTSHTRGFIHYLKTTLVPDLKDSGYEATAEDFETAIRFMEAGMHHGSRLWNTSSRKRRARRNPMDVTVSWTGRKASYVSPVGNYGGTGYSELAMHTGGAGKQIVRFALFKDKGAKGRFVRWAQVEYGDGKVLDGLTHEVLSPEILRILGRGDYARAQLPGRKQKLQLWALSKGVAANRHRKVKSKLRRKSVRRNVPRTHPVWQIGEAAHKFLSKLDLPHLRRWRDVTMEDIATGTPKAKTAAMGSAQSVYERYQDFAYNLGKLSSKLSYRDVWRAPLRIVAGAWGMMEEMRSDF